MSALKQVQRFDEITLGDAVTFQRGFDITKSEQSEGVVPIVSSSGVSSFHNKSKVKGPGVIIGRKGTLGTVHYQKNDFWPHDTTLWVKDFKRNDPRFVSYFLKTLHLENFDTGSSNPTLNRNHIHKIKVVFPKKDFQRKIAAVLSAYDDLIENNKRRISLLEKMAEEIYREWFVRLRFPGHKKVKVVKGVPEGWERVQLQSVCSLIKRGITPSYNDTVKTLIINQRCIRQGGVNLSDARPHDTKIPTEKYIQYGDILINSTGVGTLGRVAVFDHEDTNMTCDTHVTICRPKNDVANLYYVGHTVRLLQTYFENMAVGSTGQSELGRDLIGATKLLLPPVELQSKFEKIVAPMWQEKRFLFRKIKKLENTRDMLLPRLISGKLSVENLDIQFPPGMMP